MTDIKIGNQQQGWHQSHNGQTSQHHFGNVFTIHHGNGIIILCQITFDVFQIFGQFTHRNDQKQKHGMAKYDSFKITVINKYGEEGRDGQNGRGEVPNKW